ncbi:PD-(D/E)XK nuclease-like domain-containing protein [Alicyclobacillus fastidiosus]|nr:PD-(D/E)XK nuclease-like domain-containing protein [Alicyclobacillus fastidiosus]GMA59705.1 hypothetical protein GCM10025859_01450 [Alicyclobacillus fastidiosus]GMA65555.1 hypothetical protein GCM10025859_59950 [Alicyclobacillus fastidiosus]
MLELNNQNYHSTEANREYMSNSQYKDFVTCEAAAMAKLNGLWKEEPSDALLMGTYVHAALEGTLEEFKQSCPELFTQKGELRSQFKLAERMYQTISNDRMCMFVLDGQKEVIMTAEFAGCLWKVKLDSYNREGGRFADVKTVKSIRDKYWDKQYGYVSFVEAFGYLRQVALYAEIESRWSGSGEWLEPLIVAVSKEDPPDKQIINVDVSRMSMELEEIEKNMPRILAVKSGLEEPTRCETCKYCRETKQLRHVLHYTELLA